eukprot:gene13299-17818_t
MPIDINLEGNIIINLVELAKELFEVYNITFNSKSYIGEHKGVFSVLYGNSSDNNNNSNNNTPQVTPLTTPINPKLIPIINNYSNSIVTPFIAPSTNNTLNTNITPLPLITHLSKLKRFSQSISPDDDIISPLIDQKIRKLLQSVIISKNINKPSNKIYIQYLEISSEVRLNLSFNLDIDRDDTTFRDDSLVTSVFRTLLLTIGSTLTKTDNSPIKFQAFHKYHIFDNSYHGLSDVLIANYIPQLIWQASLALTPLRLLYSVSKGIWDFMYMPAAGFFISRHEFWIGIKRGLSSLLRRTLVSISGALSHFTSTIQVGLVSIGIIDAYTYYSLNNSSTHTNNNFSSPTNGTNTSSLSLLSFMKNDHDNQHNYDNRNSSELRLLASNKIKGLPKDMIQGIRLGMIGFINDPKTGFQLDGFKGLFLGFIKG